MNNLAKSVILLGIDWSKAAKTVADRELKLENEDFYVVIDDLDKQFKKLR